MLPTAMSPRLHAHPGPTLQVCKSCEGSEPESRPGQGLYRGRSLRFPRREPPEEPMHIDRAPRTVVAFGMLGAVLLTLADAAPAQQAQQRSKSPNIVFVLSDDEDL